MATPPTLGQAFSHYIFLTFDSLVPLLGNAEQDSLAVKINFISLSEISPNGDLVKHIDFTGFSFYGTNNETSPIQNFDWFLQSGNSFIAVNFSLFGIATSLPYGNSTITTVPNTVKWSITIRDWNFSDAANVLTLILNISSLTPLHAIPTKNSSREKIYELVNSRILLYIRLVEYALAMGNEFSISSSLSEELQLSFVIPYFQGDLYYDPTFLVVLISEEHSSTTTANTKWFGLLSIVLLPLALGTIALIGLSFCVYKHNKQKTQKKQLRTRLATLV